MAKKCCLAVQSLLCCTATVWMLMFGRHCVIVIMYGWAIFWRVSSILVKVLSLALKYICEPLVLALVFIVHFCFASRSEVTGCGTGHGAGLG